MNYFLNIENKITLENLLTVPLPETLTFGKYTLTNVLGANTSLADFYFQKESKTNNLKEYQEIVILDAKLKDKKQRFESINDKNQQALIIREIEDLERKVVKITAEALTNPELLDLAFENMDLRYIVEYTEATIGLELLKMTNQKTTETVENDSVILQEHLFSFRTNKANNFPSFLVLTKKQRQAQN